MLGFFSVVCPRPSSIGLVGILSVGCAFAALLFWEGLPLFSVFSLNFPRYPPGFLDCYFFGFLLFSTRTKYPRVFPVQQAHPQPLPQMNMTRNILNHFTYGMDSMDYRHSTRFGPPMHDRGFGPSRPNPRTDPMARQHPHQHQSRGGSASHPATVQSNNASGPPRRRIGVAVCAQFHIP